MPQIIEVPGHGQVEFPDGMSDQDITGAIQKNLSPPSASMGDRIAGTPLARLAMGAASPLIGAAQLGAHVGDVANRAMGVEPVVSPWIDAQIARYKAAKERGMKASGTEGYDWMGLLGSLAPTSIMAKGLGAALPQATSVLGRAGVGAVQGGAAAAAQPVENTDEGFWQPKGAQAALGTVMGGAVPLITGGVQATARAISPLADLFRGQTGIENLARKGYEKNIGKDRIQEVKDALLQAREIVPGDKPTASEAVAHLPSGSPIQALQKLTATTEGGPSAAFGDRLAKQMAARDIAGRVRNTLTAPLREEALTLANQGGVKAVDVLDGLAGIQQQPDLAASDVVSKSLSHLSEKIQSLTDKNGVIDARALYTVRKELGNTIGKYSQETQNWDKRLTGRIQGDIQKGMDWAINNAIERAKPSLPLAAGATPGPTVWDQYLSEFSKRSQDMADSLARKKLSLKPLQSTTLDSSRDIATKSMPHVALLSRPVVVANALLSHFGKTNIEPKIDALNTNLLLNPNKLGQFLDQVPPRYQPMIDALMRQAPAMAGTMAGRTQ